MRVSVDFIEQGLEGVPIPVPSEMLRLLKHIHGSYTLWPKHSIILEQPTQDVPGPSTSDRTILREVASVSRPPLVPEHVLRQLPSQLQQFHEAYLQAPQDVDCFTIVMPAGLLYDFEYTFMMSWDDVTDFLTLDELDICIIQLWTMYLANYIVHQNVDAGIMDPGRINRNTFASDSRSAYEYMADTMVKYQDAKFIFAPYYQSHHWIFLVIVPRDKMVYIYDSTVKKKLEALQTEKKETKKSTISFGDLYYITEH